MSIQNVVNQFSQLFNASAEVPFDKEWHNGTGYFNGAVDEEIVGIKHSTAEDGRRLIIIPVQYGMNVVIFERYQDSQKIAFNLPTRYKNEVGRKLHDKFPDALRLDDEFDLLMAIDVINEVSAEHGWNPHNVDFHDSSFMSADADTYSREDMESLAEELENMEAQDAYMNETRDNP